MCCSDVHTSVRQPSCVGLCLSTALHHYQVTLCVCPCILASLLGLFVCMPLHSCITARSVCVYALAFLHHCQVCLCVCPCILASLPGLCVCPCILASLPGLCVCPCILASLLGLCVYSLLEIFSLSPIIIHRLDCVLVK